MSRAAGASGARVGALRSVQPRRTTQGSPRGAAAAIVPGVASALAVTAGAAVLLGWALEVQWLKSIRPGWGSMKPNTALAFILAGLALGTLHRVDTRPVLRVAGRVSATLVAVLGAVTLSEYAFGWNAGIDQFLFRMETPTPGWFPARMAPESALSFLLLGVGLLLIDVQPRGGPKPADFFAISLAALAYLPILGYAYGARALWGIAPYATIALHAAILSFILAIGLMLSRPTRGAAGLLTSPRIGGQLARRLLPACVLIPALLGLVRLHFEAQGYYAPAIGTAALVASVSAVFSAITGGVASALNRSDEERQRSQERVEEERGRLESVLEQLPAGVMIADAPSGRLLMVNRQAEQVLRAPVPRGQPVDHGRWTAFSSDGRPLGTSEWGIVQALRAGKILHDQELAIVRGDGSRGWLLSSSAPIRDRQGQAVAAVATFLDITERKQLERELRDLKDELEERVRSRTVELTAANQELEAFAYSVSHDLRAPLRWMNGFSEALLEEYADRLDERGRRYLRDILESTQHMARLIDDLLHLSRVTRVELVRERVDVTALAREVAQEIQRRDPRPEMMISIAEGLTTVADPDLLRVVLANLLGNAWKFTRPRTAPRIDVGGLDHGTPVFYVCDNGVGFDMAYAGRLFRPFERLHKLADFEGTGIGLALVRRIVERHGGRVWAESEVEGGATFFFTLSPEEAPA